MALCLITLLWVSMLAATCVAAEKFAIDASHWLLLRGLLAEPA